MLKFLTSEFLPRVLSGLSPLVVKVADSSRRLAWTTGGNEFAEPVFHVAHDHGVLAKYPDSSLSPPVPTVGTVVPL